MEVETLQSIININNKKDYKESLVKIRNARKIFVSELEKTSGIRTIASQANYVMLEITCGLTAKELTKTLLINYNLFIKDLSSKIKLENKQYIRVAVRNEEDNARLVDALRKELK